jgi:hypothetical protein
LPVKAREREDDEGLTGGRPVAVKRRGAEEEQRRLELGNEGKRC